MRARDNPFRTECLHSVCYRFCDVTPEVLLSRLEELSCRAAVVGPEGSGKTTLAEDLARRLAEAGFEPAHLRLDTRQRKFPRAFLDDFFAGATGKTVVFLDGVERMGRLAWHRFKRRTRDLGGLIITSHKPGLLPMLIECTPRLEVLQEIVDELLGMHDDETSSLAERLFARHDGNFRAVLRELYDSFARK